MPYRMKTLLFCSRSAPKFSSRRIPTAIHTLGSMSSAAAAADAPEEFAALADYTIDDFMSEAASDVEIFATTEGHGDVRAEEIRFLARDPQAHDRVMSRVARLPRRALRRLLRAAGFDEPVWQTRIRWATAASLAEEVGEWYRSGAAPKRIVEAALAAHVARSDTSGAPKRTSQLVFLSQTNGRAWSQRGSTRRRRCEE